MQFWEYQTSGSPSNVGEISHVLMLHYGLCSVKGYLWTCTFVPCVAVRDTLRLGHDAWPVCAIVIAVLVHIIMTEERAQ
jgi:hypothetical protein